MYREYPGFCARCGKGWGDHLSDLALKRNPHACRFKPLPGEIETPVIETDTEHEARLEAEAYIRSCQ